MVEAILRPRAAAAASLVLKSRKRRKSLCWRAAWFSSSRLESASAMSSSEAATTTLCASTYKSHPARPAFTEQAAGKEHCSPFENDVNKRVRKTSPKTV